MTRRDRLIRILNRLSHPYGALGYDMGTTGDLEELCRNALWWRGLARHNARVMNGWFMETLDRYKDGMPA